MQKRCKLISMDSLIEKAKEVSKNAYAPYSKFRVGACVLTASGNTYEGCNVENASYGLAVCAERNAIFNAIAHGETAISAIAIYSPDMDNCLPCGACRQVIFEFQKDKEIEIVTLDKDELVIHRINELLPEGFKL